MLRDDMRVIGHRNGPKLRIIAARLKTAATGQKKENSQFFYHRFDPIRGLMIAHTPKIMKREKS